MQDIKISNHIEVRQFQFWTTGRVASDMESLPIAENLRTLSNEPAFTLVNLVVRHYYFCMPSCGWYYHRCGT